ncbi:MAG TPA: PA2779 family protein [Gallionella sp.]|nr:PA2779 family protein [Gallionella sp.]
MNPQNSPFMRWVSRMVIVCMMVMGMPVQNASASIVETDQVNFHEMAMQDRAKINSFLDRQDVIAQMQKEGITSAQAQARISALTDEEAHTISGKLDQLPAGGDVIGVVFAVFIILLITDIFGLTKVFPFTRSIRK